MQDFFTRRFTGLHPSRDIKQDFALKVISKFLSFCPKWKDGKYLKLTVSIFLKLFRLIFYAFNRKISLDFLLSSLGTCKEANFFVSIKTKLGNFD